MEHLYYSLWFTLFVWSFSIYATLPELKGGNLRIRWGSLILVWVLIPGAAILLEYLIMRS